MRRADAYQGVDEILQADVMRFMAIIAFCLIAILSLVRSLEPARPAVAPAVPEAVAVPEPRQEVAVRKQPERAVEAVAVPMPVAEPAPALGRAAAPDTADAAPEPVEMADEHILAAVEPSVDAPPPEPSATPDPLPHAAPGAEEGLSLRFASDQDFLRLVNRGEIQVFAFRDGEVLSIGPDFRFEAAPAPGSLHELLPETIPDLMTAALEQTTSGATYRWGVAMPERMARQIRAYVDQGATGELIIDRFGEVRHRGA